MPARRLALGLVACPLFAAGCGGATIPKGALRKAASAGEQTTGTATTKTTTGIPKSGPQSVVARIDASSDAIIAEGKVRIAQGAPSDAEVRKEIEAAKKAGIALPSGESAASFENAEGATSGPGAEAHTPETPWNPRLKPIADWIIPVLAWAYEHGWRGTVTSGFRTFYEQAQLNAAGAFSAPAGLSNHETTRYPGGAVDVTQPGQLIAVLAHYPGPLKLIGGKLGAVDPEHFSSTGF
ncbi:MAG TPA: hypothetical protein VGG08_02980 [Solirubrobacteraceae bacterium]|jgi:hypothetical protein